MVKDGYLSTYAVIPLPRHAPDRKEIKKFAFILGLIILFPRIRYITAVYIFTRSVCLSYRVG